MDMQPFPFSLLALCFLSGAEVRGVDLQSITGGILHTKLWVVDKKHMYLGSANMDWRSLTQVSPRLRPEAEKCYPSLPTISHNPVC